MHTIARITINANVIRPSFTFQFARQVWIFGDIWCSIWLAVDVWMCTASILNLCAISLDRYLAVTRPVNYPQVRELARNPANTPCFLPRTLYNQSGVIRMQSPDGDVYSSGLKSNRQKTKIHPDNISRLKFIDAICCVNICPDSIYCFTKSSHSKNSF